MNKIQKEYGDIINLEHHISKTHKQMSIKNRVAQFAPFAALIGLEEAIKNTVELNEKNKDI